MKAEGYSMVYCGLSVRELRLYNSINISELLNVNIHVTFLSLNIIRTKYN